MKVIIHAGIHRTGTTSLQYFLSGNRAALAVRGIGYPGEELNHQKLVWSLRRGDSGVEDLLAVIATAGEAATVVLSGEDFSILTDLDWLGALAERHETHVVFYLRRQDHWVMSWYNQHIKWPFVWQKSRMGPQAFLDTLEDFYWLNYEALLERWCAVLGQDRVGVGVIEPGQVEDVRSDFLGRLGLGREGFEFGGAQANDSLPVHVLEIARHLDLAGMNAAQRIRVIGALRAGLADKGSPAKTVYSPEERIRIIDGFAVANAAVARKFFARDALFFEPAPPPDAPYFSFPNLPRQRLMREWVAPVVRELLKSS